MKRGTCATLIVRDGRIVTDPENPGVPHQCDFRPLEAVTANRASIAGRKRRMKFEHGTMMPWERYDDISRSTFTLFHHFIIHRGFVTSTFNALATLNLQSYVVIGL